MNKHNERAELIRELRAEANRPSPHGSATIVCALMEKAAAMLEAQPADQAKGLEADCQPPVWSHGAEAMYWLNEIEKYQGGTNGPTIKLRAALELWATGGVIAYRYKKRDSGNVVWMSGGKPTDPDAFDIEPLYATPPAQPAEQAKGQEAVAWMDECLVAIHAAACTLGNFGSYFFGSSRQVGLRQDQVEQYQEMHRKAEEGVNALMDLHDQLRGLQPDHTTPPAQPAREWVGLTDDELQLMAFRAVKAHPEWRHLNFTVPVGAEIAPFVAELYRAIESKLREKNAGLTAAVPDIEVTNEMIEAGRKAALTHGPLLGSGQSLLHIFRDMLAAAPKPQEASQ